MTTAFKIESGIPAPTPSASAGIADTLKKLKVGDSFVVQDGRQRSTAITTSIRLGIKIVTRKVEGGSGIRVWRAA